MFRKSSLKIQGLYCITAKVKDSISYEKLVENFCAAGADIVQFRTKELSAKELVATGKKLRQITKRYRVPLIVNDRLDIALAIGADGVHLGQRDLPVKAIKRLTTARLSSPKSHDLRLTTYDSPRFNRGLTNFIVGISTHSLKEAIDAEKNGADYISFGPIFNSPTKPELKPVGLELLEKVKSKLKIPVVAIGGINITNIKQVLDAGADAVAVISAVCNSKDIKKSVKDLKCKFRLKDDTS